MDKTTATALKRKGKKFMARGAHERTIREFTMQHGGIHIGSPLRDFRGVLTGVPIYEQDEHNLRMENTP